MPISRRRFLAGAAAGVALLMAPSATRMTRGAAGMMIGAALVTQQHPDWHAVQLPILRAMHAAIVRIPIAPGFGNDPSMLVDLVAAGVDMVILQVEGTDDSGTMTDKAQRDLFDRGWLHAAEAAGLQTIVELGNEPDRTPQTAAAFVDDVTRTVAMVRPHVWVAVSLPTRLDYTRAIANVFPLCDALCPHLYGYEHLTDGGNTDEWAILNWVLANTRLLLYLSEIGIDSPSSDMTTKASRMVADLATLDAGRVKGACIFTISDDPSWARDALTLPAAAVIGAGAATPMAAAQSRAPADPFAPVPNPHDPGVLWMNPQTGHTIRGDFRDAWENDGGLTVFGYPISEQFTEDGLTVQYFERAVFEWSPGRWPAHWNVTYRLLGVMAAKTRGYIRG